LAGVLDHADAAGFLPGLTIPHCADFIIMMLMVRLKLICFPAIKFLIFHFFIT